MLALAHRAGAAPIENRAFYFAVSSRPSSISPGPKPSAMQCSPAAACRANSSSRKNTVADDIFPCRANTARDAAVAPSANPSDSAATSKILGPPG